MQSTVSLLSCAPALEGSLQRGWDITIVVTWAVGLESLTSYVICFLSVFSKRHQHSHQDVDLLEIIQNLAAVGHIQ